MKELLMSAEYIMASGNEQVILCERGIRTYETYTRNTLDLSAVPMLHELSHLPVVVDPSHATGHRPSRDADGTCRNGRRRRRYHGRGPQRPDPRAVRRRAVADPGSQFAELSGKGHEGTGGCCTMRVGIVGLGLIGGSFAKAYSEAAHMTVLAFDRDESVLSFAQIARRGLRAAHQQRTSARATSSSLPSTPKPPSHTSRNMAPYIGKKPMVIDCCGTKRRGLPGAFAAGAATRLYLPSAVIPMAGTAQLGL